ncbi:leucine-rich repeat domain-containing protein [Listeria ivanovii]|uniref:leucine-rich repeat domain-containing protein n=5 Tax=Listeria ivanovii TaxID=1638 RepID=UPI0003EC83E4|nr:leucine-rich repeat domain-containing protein [Listeria ivanovii]AHI56616.1 hypothetical protein AX25_11145 [Listeria ivanovii WSLC3009]MBC1758923.1 hypothetical protein [Listeria ivanovii]SNV46898.1 Internalin-A precursor [Listeria ivanovii subsp. ivanovii]SNV97170.1 Internalin-A precursor [Listeria ivanovii subsp. ivanovii]
MIKTRKKQIVLLMLVTFLLVSPFVVFADNNNEVSKEIENTNLPPVADESEGEGDQAFSVSEEVSVPESQSAEIVTKESPTTERPTTERKTSNSQTNVEAEIEPESKSIVEPHQVKAERNVVVFESSELEQRVRRTLKLKTDDPITQEKMADLIYLTIISSDMDSLKGLEYAINLQTLDIGGTDTITDLSPISNLKSLTFFKMANSKISNLESLKNLVNLKYLRLGSTELEDISPLSNLVNLTNLFLSCEGGGTLRNNKLNDLTPIANLTKLKSLIIGDAPNITSIQPLAGLSSLENLYLLNNKQITNFSSLAALPNLKSLSLSKNANLTDISSIAGLKNKLTKFQASQCKISNIDVLADFTKLTTLELSVNPIVDISPLKNLTNLTFLSMTSNNIMDVSPLKSVFGVNGNKISVTTQKLKQSVTAKKDKTITVKNLWVDETGKPIIPTKISDKGVYNAETNEITWYQWNLTNKKPTYSYSFAEQSSEYSGGITVDITWLPADYDDDKLIDDEDPDDNNNGILDPDDEEKISYGPLRMEYISNLDFEEIGISGNTKESIASYDQINESGTKKEVKNFIRIADQRGTYTAGNTKGWTLTAKRSSFSNQENSLKGETLTFKNPEAITKQGSSSTGINLVGSMEMPIDSEIIVAQSSRTLKDGTWDITFDEVALNVPGSSRKVKGEYQASIEWILADTPTNL